MTRSMNKRTIGRSMISLRSSPYGSDISHANRAGAVHVENAERTWPSFVAALDKRMSVDSLQNRWFALWLSNFPFGIPIRDSWIVCILNRAGLIIWSALIYYQSSISEQFAALRRSVPESHICRYKSNGDEAPAEEYIYSVFKDELN